MQTISQIIAEALAEVFSRKMKINVETGIVNEAEFLESPNHDERPENETIDLLVIHNISLPPNEFGGPYITQLFTNSLNPDEHPFFDEIKDLRVSAHLLVRRNGDVIQFVPLHMRAWHAGVSEFHGKSTCNNFSIGIELEGADDIPYEDIQYEKLAQLTKAIMQDYPNITLERICGHCEIAPDRKSDPGPAFDWSRYKQLVQSLG